MRGRGYYGREFWQASTWADNQKKLTQLAREKRDRKAIDKLAEYQSQIFEDTVAAVWEGHYRSYSGKSVALEPVDALIKNSCMYSYEFFVDFVPARAMATSIFVENSDSFDVARKYIRDGYNPIVLNMASSEVVSGSIKHNASTQEESLLRRSNLFASLYQFTENARLYRLPRSSQQYPMDTNFGGIYSPNVTVFRSSPDTGYEFMDEPFHTSVVSVAAIKRPVTNEDGLMIGPMVTTDFWLSTGYLELFKK